MQTILISRGSRYPYRYLTCVDASTSRNAQVLLLIDERSSEYVIDSSPRH
ncbi:hypothetical protein [Corynebacterium cystitidis]|nr:hypothetical protein [Corynebacterium cystitidis]